MNRFRCQYQKGKTCVSQSFESEHPITSAQILVSLAKLAIKVGNKVNLKTGRKVALKVLKIQEYVIKCIHDNNNIGNGPINSFLLNHTGKSKIDKSERIDLEFYGPYGESDKTSIINRYITKYKEMKGWK